LFWLRWPSALVADLAVVGLTVRVLNAQQLERPDAVIAVQLLLLAAYLGSFASRTLVRGRAVIPFEVIQTMAVLAVGLGGAVMVAHRSGAGEFALGTASAALGLGGYAAAVCVRRAAPGPRRQLLLLCDAGPRPHAHRPAPC